MLKKITGRPKVDNPVNVRFSVCVDKDTADNLNDYCARENVTKSVAVRRGLALLFGKKQK